MWSRVGLEAELVAAEDEYKTERTLPAFARKQLGQTYRVSFVFADAKVKHHLPGIELLNTADAMLLSVRRKPLLTAELEAVKRFVLAGKPVIAIRTSSHAFAPRKGEKLPDGVTMWEAFDKEILGCEYKGHYPNMLKTRSKSPARPRRPTRYCKVGPLRRSSIRRGCTSRIRSRTTPSCC